MYDTPSSNKYYNGNNYQYQSFLARVVEKSFGSPKVILTGHLGLVLETMNWKMTTRSEQLSSMTWNGILCLPCRFSFLSCGWLTGMCDTWRGTDPFLAGFFARRCLGSRVSCTRKPPRSCRDGRTRIDPGCSLPVVLAFMRRIASCSRLSNSIRIYSLATRFGTTRPRHRLGYSPWVRFHGLYFRLVPFMHFVLICTY